MTRTRKNFRQNSLIGGSNNAGPANKSPSSFNNLSENLKGMHLESRIDSLLKEIGCESADGVEKTKCLFDFLLNSEGGILPSILFMIKIVKDVGPKTDYKTQLKTFVKPKHPLVIFINTEISIDENQQKFMDELTEEFQRRVDYTLPKSTQNMLLNIREILFSSKFEQKEPRMNFKTLMSKASFTKTMKGKAYMNPKLSHLIAKKFFVRLSEASDVKKRDRKIKAVVDVLELTLKQFLQMEPGAGPGVDALLHELEGEVALLEMQNAAEQAKMATLQQKLDAAKRHVADAAAREAAEADAGVAKLERRYAASRKAPKAQGVSKTAKKGKKKSKKLKKKKPSNKKKPKKKGSKKK